MKHIPTQDVNKQQFKDEYQTAINTLTTIRDADPQTVTNLQVIVAVQYEAKVLLFITKLLMRIIGG